MPIRELRTFLAVAETGSFAAAARVVGRTQSAITVQMKALEEEFGLVMFDRARRPPGAPPSPRPSTRSPPTTGCSARAPRPSSRAICASG